MRLRPEAGRYVGPSPRVVSGDSPGDAPSAAYFAQPAPVVVTDIALGWLGDAAEASTRLSKRRDADALHDFRVAVRRLRSVLRAYREHVGRAGSKKLRRKLHSLARATAKGRDAEVQFAWMAAQRERLARRERAGLNWILKTLRDEVRAGYRDARRTIRGTFPDLANTLQKRLASARADSDAAPAFGEAAATRVAAHTDALIERLTLVTSSAHDAEAHRARIAAKRLRYLLEPMTPYLPAAGGLVTRLKALQDVLGDLHDLHVAATHLATAIDAAARAKARELHRLAVTGDTGALERARRRDERLGLAALAGLAQRRIEALYDRFAVEWTAGGGALAFAREVREAIGAPTWRRRITPKAPSPPPPSVPAPGA